MPKISNDPADYIVPLNMDGLQGRMLRVPAKNRSRSREILFVYGHHSSLERWWGVIKVLNRYGTVTMPDLPGFGGMDSLYKIGQKPTIDNLADYLAAFVKLQYKRRRVSIAGLSFGFVVVTRMLQKHPELIHKVDFLVSFVGFAHRDDFAFSKRRHNFYMYGARIFSRRLPAMIFRGLFLNPVVLRLAYGKTFNAKKKFSSVAKDELKAIMDFEVYLWRNNEIRTYMHTTAEFLNLDNCTKRVDLPVWHIMVKNDRYFDHRVVEQHMRVIFSDFNEVEAKVDTHAPSIIIDEKSAAPFIPPKIRKILASKRD